MYSFDGGNVVKYSHKHVMCVHVMHIESIANANSKKP